MLSLDVAVSCLICKQSFNQRLFQSLPCAYSNKHLNALFADLSTNELKMTPLVGANQLFAEKPHNYSQEPNLNAPPELELCASSMCSM